MVTIKDIANAANVSPSTVSRVISGNSRISVATQEKVKKIMADFNYQPNHAARTLITKNQKQLVLFKSKVTKQQDKIHLL